MTSESHSTPKNAAGVPLVLVATAGDNGGLTVDYSEVPVTPFDAAAVAAMTKDEAQAAMDALIAKYDGVQCERDRGSGATEFEDEDQFTMGADWSFLMALEHQGADRILAHQHLAAAKAKEPASLSPADARADDAPADAGTSTSSAISGYIIATGDKAPVTGTAAIVDAAPVHNGPLTLTVAEHAHTKSLLERIRDGSEEAFDELVALLRHVV